MRSSHVLLYIKMNVKFSASLVCFVGVKYLARIRPKTQLEMRKELTSFLPGSSVNTAVFSRCSLSKMRAPRLERFKYNLMG